MGSTLKARLAQAGDVEGFMAELTDVLEKVSGSTFGRTCPAMGGEEREGCLTNGRREGEGHSLTEFSISNLTLLHSTEL